MLGYTDCMGAYNVYNAYHVYNAYNEGWRFCLLLLDHIIMILKLTAKVRMWWPPWDSNGGEIGDNNIPIADMHHEIGGIQITIVDLPHEILQ